MTTVRTTKGIFGFLKSRGFGGVKNDDLNSDEWETLLEEVFRQTERPPTLVILRGVLYDMKKKKQKEEAQRIFKEMLEETRRITCVKSK